MTLSCNESQSLQSFLLLSYKLPQTHWLKTIEIYSLTVLETRNPKSRCQQDLFPLQALRENPSHASPSCWRIQHFLAYRHTAPFSASVFTWPFLLCVCVSNLPLLPLIRIPIMGFRAHTKSRRLHPEILNLITSTKKTLFSNQVIFSGTLGQDLNTPFGGYCSIYYSPFLTLLPSS